MSLPLNVIQLECEAGRFEKNVWTMLDESINNLRRSDGSFSLFMIYRPSETIVDGKELTFPILGLIPFRNERDPMNLVRNHEEREIYPLIQKLEYPSIPSIVGAGKTIDQARINFGDTIEIHFETIPYLIYRMRIRDKIASQWVSCGVEGNIDYYICFAHPKKLLHFLGEKEKSLYELTQQRFGILDESICCICSENLIDHSYKCGHMVCYKCLPRLQGKCPNCQRHGSIYTSCCVIDGCYLEKEGKPFCAHPCGCVYGQCLPTGKINKTYWAFEDKDEKSNRWKLKADPQTGLHPECLRCKRCVLELIRLYWRVRWQTRVFLFKAGVVKKPPEISPLQWLAAPKQVRIPSSLLDDLNETEKLRCRSVEREVQLISQLSPLFPSSLLLQDWRFLIECQNIKQRLEHLKFLKKLENEKTKTRKAQKSIDSSSKVIFMKDDCQLLSIPGFALKRWENKISGARQLIPFRLDEHPKLVVDCRYFPLLSPRGANLTAMQHPWPLYFMNWGNDKRFLDLQEKHLASFFTKDQINVIVSESSYVDVLPKQNLIYLSPDADEELTQINSKDIFVLGGIVDRTVEKNLHPQASKQTALQDGILCKKLPLDRYITWKSGSKFLTLLAVQGILHDVYENGAISMSLDSGGDSGSFGSSYSQDFKNNFLLENGNAKMLLNGKTNGLSEESHYSLCNEDNELIDVKPIYLVNKEQSNEASQLQLPSGSYDEDDWMDEVDVSRFSDLAASGFEMIDRSDSKTHGPSTNGRCFPKPNYSYSCLIALALKNSRTGRLTVSEIYAFMCENFPYFKTAPSGWKNSVRHNLSLNKCFMKIEVETPGVQGRKSCLWMIRPEKAAKMEADLQRWRDKDAGNIEEAIRRPEDIDAVHEGRRGVPREDRSLRTIENTIYPAMKNVLIVQSGNGIATTHGHAIEALDATGHIESPRRTVPHASSHPGPSRPVLDLNDRVGIGFPETKVQNKTTITFPVRVSARDDRGLIAATSSTARQQNLSHKPNILRRSTNAPLMLQPQPRLASSKTPVKSLSELLPLDYISKLEITPTKEENSPERDFLCSFRSNVEESPVRTLFSSYEAAHAALTNNSLLNCALEQSPYKDMNPLPESLLQYHQAKAPPSIYYIPEFITEHDEEVLLKEVYQAPKPKWEVLSNRRLLNYGGIVGKKGLIPMNDFPTELTKTIRMIDKLQAFPSTPNHCLVNEYTPGQGIMAHTDGPAFYPLISTITLGSHTVLNLYDSFPSENEATEKEQFRALETRYRGSMLLERRSLVFITDDAYSKMLHGINEVTEDVLNEKTWNVLPERFGERMTRKTRVSLTIRYVPKVSRNAALSMLSK
ncbi:unnamed protein product, partial [Mesorhabditis belari]|uniref:Uncharacterized protein n=1 Tax=Mesorhabditis belari TaxID=2138241 RepID=A0AAF3FR57_9BILA